jgi:hypothetical protein
MNAVRIAHGAAKEYIPILLVALGVALVTTLVAAFINSVHQVGADEMVAQEHVATPGPDGMQTLGVVDWGVRLTVPLAPEMPAMKYAKQSDSSIGLSTEDLEKFGPACRASRNALGALMRVPAGTLGSYSDKSANVQFVQTIGQYDYGYVVPGGDCTGAGTAQIVNRERSILIEALVSLAPFGE